MARLSPALCLALLAGRVAAGVPASAGCFYHGYSWQGEKVSWEGIVSSTDSLNCQEKCLLNSECKTFEYTLGGCAMFKAGAKLVKANVPAISGPEICAAHPPQCSPTVDQAAFPGDTVEATNAAFSTGMQPPPDQCWPKEGIAGDVFGSKLANCPDRVVVEDTATGWHGKCMGLTRIILPAGETCQAHCERNVECPVWQLTDKDECWQGLGKDCLNRTGFVPKGSQRIVRGSYRVLKDLTGVQVMGLAHAFNTDNFATIAEGKDRCKNVCLSDVHCQYWQFSQTAGCYVEEHESSVAYPMTVGAAYATTGDAAENMVAGEYILRVCPSAFTTVAPPTTTTGLPTTTLATLAPTMAPTVPPTPAPTLSGVVPPVNTVTGAPLITTVANREVTVGPAVTTLPPATLPPAVVTTLAPVFVTEHVTSPPAVVTTQLPTKWVNVATATTTELWNNSLGSSSPGSSSLGSLGPIASSGGSSLATSSGGSSSSGFRSSDSTSSIPWWLLLALLGLLCLGGLGAAMMGGKGKKKKKTTKDVKAKKKTKKAPVEEAAPLMEPVAPVEYAAPPVTSTVMPATTYTVASPVAQPVQTVVAPPVMMNRSVEMAQPMYAQPMTAQPVVTMQQPVAMMAAPAATMAQPVGTYVQAPQMMQAPSLFDQIDTNHDGVISAQEFAAGMRR